jgi:AraC-like DNA-binding protein
MQAAASRLRETHRTIAQVAAELGYESEASFTRAFKRAQGISPGRYRAGERAGSTAAAAPALGDQVAGGE